MPVSRYQWTLIDAPSTRGRIFRRSLDPAELSFVWDGVLNGSMDSVHHTTLRRLCGGDKGPGSMDLFSEANIIQAWLSTKRRYPLAGAILVPSGNGNPINSVAEGKGSRCSGGAGSSLFASKQDTSTQEQAWDFVVYEADLSILRPGEIVFGEVINAEEAEQRAAALFEHSSTDPRPLSNALLTRLYVFREINPSGSPSVLHVMTLTAHSVMDVTASHTFLRCFVDTLARGGGGDVSVLEPAHIPLEHRLMAAVPSVELEPAHVRALSLAKRRWRRAVGRIIFQLRMAKRQGGHTLPCRFTNSTPYTAARSCRVTTTLTLAQSSAVIANCRLHDVTFGNGLVPLAQVAMTRVLFRRYLRGEISETEWEYRKRQPYMGGGPLNLRPYLDEAWFQQGGGGEFVLSISLASYQLPFMTLGNTSHCRGLPSLPDGAPPFEDLLSFDRFLHRAGLMKKQMEEYLRHPLSFEIACAVGLARLEHTRHTALEWMKRSRTGGACSDKVLAVADVPVMQAHEGSTFGNTDSVFPSEYPLPSTHPLSPYSSTTHPAKAGYMTPPLPPTCSPTSDTRSTIVAECSELHLHVPPADLYLGAASWGGRLSLFAYYDGNMFEDAVVREWLDEAKGAVLWYLGRMHTKSQQTGRGTNDVAVTGRIGDGLTGLDQGHLKAKL